MTKAEAREELARLKRGYYVHPYSIELIERLITQMPDGSAEPEAWLAIEPDGTKRFWSTEASAFLHQGGLNGTVLPVYAHPPAPAQFRPWVVTDGSHSIGETKFRTLDEHGIPKWTLDPQEALQFARRQDAELFCKEDEDAWGIVQIPVESAPAQSAVPKLTSAMIRAVLDHPYTSIHDSDARHERLGWFLLAWGVAHEAAAPQPSAQPKEPGRA